MSEQQSVAWSLSGFGDEIDHDPRVQVAVLQALGADHIEVRSAWATNVAEMSDEQVARLQGILAENSMSVSAVASPIGKVDVSEDVEHEVARLRRVVEVAKALDTTNIRVFSFFHEGREPDAVRDDVLVRMAALARVAERAGVTLLHENEKDIFGDVPSRIVDMVESVGSPALRLAWDNANFVQVGVRPMTEAYETLRPYVDYLQVKDAVMETGKVVPAGHGDGQLPETVAAFARSGYAGFASLEPHLDEAFTLGGFSGPVAFGDAARAFRSLTDAAGVVTGR
ncbi:hypothetical protein GCM10017714_28980 [Curtobacterium pusillum]|nr:sugar phosphate isomerase/epimerase family protein [Curtobacterium pusillum]GLK33028.1 hypothetical protein GCM10017610_33130 [Curtobacterium pusillum]